MSFLPLTAARAAEWVVRGTSDIVTFDAMLEFHVERSSQLPSAPIEQSSFATYNRVVEPTAISCTLGVRGASPDLQDAVNRLTDLSEGEEKITLVTPEQTYSDMMLESFNYRRDASNGRGVLYVELRLIEVREVAAFQTTASVEEPIYPEDCADGSCADNIDRGEVQTSPSGAEEADAGKKPKSLLNGAFGVIIP